MNPLNKVLYERLRAVFGRVAISNQGEAFQSGPCVSDGYGRYKREIIAAGEYYHINCPYCRHKTNGRSRDGRMRLWINHRWGVTTANQEENKRMWSLAYCFNEGCMQEAQFRKQLRDTVFTDIGMRRNIVVEQGTVHAPLSKEIDWPGLCLPLHELPMSHPANEYLSQSRKFDPYELSHKYNLRFCMTPSPGYRMAVNRIVCPVYMGGKMVTWQSRYVGEADWKSVPKFYNFHGAAKSATLYNLDRAIGSPFVTLVEGPMDAWRIGNGAVALLGRTVSETQVALICKHWKAAVIALDADAVLQSEAAVERLRRHIPSVLVPMPTGFDPDTMPTDAFWDLVLKSADEQGISQHLLKGA